MVKVYQATLAASPKRLSDAMLAGGGEAANIPFRQLLLTASGATVTLGDASLTGSNGVTIATSAAQPLSIGPFMTGPVKLSDLYAAGAGATLTVLGVAF